ncbi:MAG: hypothetical protein LBT62_08325 [Deltaproteobacteria bacterium]|nr:hypothetical protein [Deltaproteobacteria bacterium]
MAFPKIGFSAAITEIFLLIPPEQAKGLTSSIRRELLTLTGQGSSGYSAPSREGYWVEIHSDSAMTLFGISQAPVVYKTFPTNKGWQLLAICRSRQTHGPAKDWQIPHETPLDLVLYLISPTNDLIRAYTEDYLPKISVLDFVTLDTITDRRAVLDLEVIDETFYADCLTCHASVQDPVALDILTVTTINGHSCSHFMSQFKLLPLKWNGEYFTKPYDRADVYDEPRKEKTTKKGLYYNEPGS